jgi:hypothetical protein
MDENNLQINITAVDDASGTIDTVAASAEGMASAVEKAASSISESLDAAFTAGEEAAIDSAIASAKAWMGTAEEIDSAVASVAETTDGDFMNISDSALTAANAASESWQASLKEIASVGVMTEEETNAAFAGMATGAEASAGKSKDAMSGMHSYFRLLIAGYLADTAGKGLIGMVQDAVNAAAGDPTKLTDLTNQLHEQQAALAKLELPISGHNLTTAQLAADQAEQATKIAITKQKIEELTQAMQPLVVAQQAAGQSAKDYDDATTKLSGDWQAFLANAGAPLLEHLAHAAEGMDKVVNAVTEWVKEHPKLTETILISLGILGTLLVTLGGIFIAIAPVIILFSMFGIAITAASMAASAAIAVIVAAVIFLVAGMIANWDNVTRKTNEIWSELVRFISQHWQDILAILLPGIGSLVDYMSNHWKTIQDDVSTAWNWILNFISGIWGKIVSGAETAIGTVQKLISGIMAPINGVTSAVSNIGGAIGGGFNAISSAIPKFAEGGIVNGPTLALVGEAGPEAIIPLSAFNGGNTLGGASGGGSGGLNIVFNSGTLQGTDASAAERFSRNLATMINQQIKLKNYN